MRPDTAAAVNREAWDRQAALALPTDRPVTDRRRVEWTQYPGHGPGIELLGDVRGATVVELGCGNGDNLAPLAFAGARCVGVDMSPVQLARARARWPHLPMQLHCADARDYLATSPASIDICLSIFGAVGLCPPDQLLPPIASRLAPGGRLVFSVPDPSWLGANRDRMRLADDSTVPVVRWAASATGWKAAVAASGLTPISFGPVDSPNGTGRCCIIGTAAKPPAGRASARIPRRNAPDR